MCYNLPVRNTKRNKRQPFQPYELALTPEEAAIANQEHFDLQAARQAQREEEAANLAEMAQAYQEGGREAVLALLREKAKTAKQPRHPLHARRD